MSSTDYYEIVDSILKQSTPNFLTNFKNLNSNKDRFLFLQSNDDVTKLLDKHIRNIDASSPMKSNNLSNFHRNQGNLFFKAGNYTKALKGYNKSILFAVNETDNKLLLESDSNNIELALALSNRSVVLLKMNRFKECIEDVNDSIHYGYPSDHKFKLLDRLATCYMREGNSSKAVENFRLMKQYLNFSDLTELQKDSQRKLIDEKISCCNDEFFDSKTKHIYDDSKDQHKSNKSIDEVINKLRFDNPLPELSKDAIRFEYSSEVGKHAVATKDIKTGEVVMADETFAKVLIPSEVGNICYYCFSGLSLESNCIQPCPSCTEVLYCSKRCRYFSKVLDRHDLECPLYSKWIRSKTGPLAWLVIRILLTLGMETWVDIVKPLNMIDVTEDNRSGDQCDDGSAVGDDFRKEIHKRNTLHSAPKLFNLVSHPNERSPTELLQYSILALWIVLLLKDNGYFEKNSQNKTDETNKSITITTVTSMDASSNQSISIIGGITLKFLQIISCNGIEITSMDVGPTLSKCHPRTLGLALYPNASLFNHSCDPDLELLFVKDICIARSIKPIAKGSPVNIDYGYIFYSTAKHSRVENLKKQYFFECKCIACLNNWPLRKHLDQNISQVYHSSLDEFKCPECQSMKLIEVKREIDPKLEEETKVVASKNNSNCSNTKISESTEYIDNPSNKPQEINKNSTTTTDLYRCTSCGTLSNHSDLKSINPTHDLQVILIDAQIMKISSNSMKLLETYLNHNHVTSSNKLTQEMVDCISTLKQCYRLLV